jgi:hypothetical protein
MNRQKLVYLRRTGRLEHHVFDLFTDTRRLEALRLALVRELRTSPGQRSLAAVIGVGRSVIRKFVEMRAVPTDENLRRLEEWAVDRPEVAPPATAVALAILVGELPAEARLVTRRRLAAELHRAHTHGGVSIPDWLASELSEVGSDGNA